MPFLLKVRDKRELEGFKYQNVYSAIRKLVNREWLRSNAIFGEGLWKKMNE